MLFAALWREQNVFVESAVFVRVQAKHRIEWKARVTAGDVIRSDEWRWLAGGCRLAVTELSCFSIQRLN